jgi:hypothetical protein
MPLGVRRVARLTTGLSRERHRAIVRLVGRALSSRGAAVALSVALASCGGGDDAQPGSAAERAEPPGTQRRSTSPPHSPDAGIPQGHAPADARAHRCRATRPARYCDRYAR